MYGFFLRRGGIFVFFSERLFLVCYFHSFSFFRSFFISFWQGIENNIFYLFFLITYFLKEKNERRRSEKNNFSFFTFFKITIFKISFFSFWFFPVEIIREKCKIEKMLFKFCQKRKNIFFYHRKRKKHINHGLTVLKSKVTNRHKLL